MPGRSTPLVTNQVYHVFNRGVASQPTFLDKRDYDRALETMSFYQNKNIPLRYSFFLRLPEGERADLLNQMRKKREYVVDILAYCLMPNHVHLLLKQLQDDGISTYMSNGTNSYTRYFNTKNKRAGPLYQGKFKAVRIETDEQLLHVTRYIHLNPFTSYVVKTLKELEHYPYSSLAEYLGHRDKGTCNAEFILSQFRSRKAYKKFLFDRADYQRELENIKHLTLEE